MSETPKKYLLEPFKKGPFELSKNKTDWATYAHHLAVAFEAMDTLPNFEEDSSIFVFSDYGGDHKEAFFNTYSFLIVSADKLSVFERHMDELREKNGLGDKEISYKDLGYGPVKRSIKEYLDISDGCIHGLLLSVCIDKTIGSVFGPDKKSAKENLLQLCDQIGVGEYHEFKLERMYRIYVIIVLILDLTTSSAHKILWQSDNDQINEEGKRGSFSDSQQHFVRFLNEFTDKEYPLFGFAKTFSESCHLTDLLSLTDLAAGMVQDLLSQHYFGRDLLVGEEKGEICKWLARKSRFLEKKCIALVKKDGLIYFEPVDFYPVD